MPDTGPAIALYRAFLTSLACAGGKKVGCSIVETFSKDVRPKELEEVLRLEYRSKLLNPKWAKAHHLRSLK